MAQHISNLYFAQLTPINRRAINCFEAAVSEALASDSTDSLRFYASSEWSGQSQSTALDPENSLAALSLCDSALPQFPHLGWRVGKRCNRVDIAIAASDHHADFRFRLSLHSESGFLILHPGAGARDTLQYLDDCHGRRTLSENQSLVLLTPRTRIAIAECEFEIAYSLSRAQCGRFYPELHGFLNKYYGTQLHKKGGLLPSHRSHIFVRQYAMGDLIGCGSFGDVRYAVDGDTGKPVAVKDVRTNERQGRRDLIREISIMEELKGLHRRGIMHRDLTSPNLLVISTDPPRAAVGDFGKAVHALDHTDPRIGPISSCAPEVASKRYDKAIDLWAWAYAVLSYLGYRALSRDLDKAITKDRLKAITAFIQARSAEEPRESQMIHICDLLAKILIWDPRDRINVAQALAHPVWAQVGIGQEEAKVEQEEEEEEGQSEQQTAKRQKHEPSLISRTSRDIEPNSESSGKTEAFSEEP